MNNNSNWLKVNWVRHFNEQEIKHWNLNEFISFVLRAAICRSDLNKSTDTNALLCRQLETEKLRSESTAEELVRTQVRLLIRLLC